MLFEINLDNFKSNNNFGRKKQFRIFIIIELAQMTGRYFPCLHIPPRELVCLVMRTFIELNFPPASLYI